ncbi:hypothetical protein [Rhizobium leguminosarum]|uniref:hypothetical protein n=1 Tax=Rhizobium leguminosarum TaxID=384 RepID=UPI002E0D8038|nr:hypothetical protein U8Q02_38695 [Rhizobium leguminosarum]
MLFTEIKEKQSNLVYPNGYPHDRSLEQIRRKVDNAGIFVLDEQACAMAANVSLTKPTSIIASLPFVKLPAEYTWIEIDNLAIRRATAALGSPNLKTDNAAVEIVRSAFLMYMDVDEAKGRKDLVIEYVHKDRPFSGRLPDGREAVLDLAPVIGRFSLADTDEYTPVDFPTLPRDTSIPTAGKVRQHLNLLEKDPAEAAAWKELWSRFEWRPHPDLRMLARSFASLMGESKVAMVEDDQGDELRRMFVTQILSALILLNCRNAVTTERVPAPERLNKKRLKQKRAPIPEYRTVKVHLSGAAKRAWSERGLSSSQVRDGAFVVGHFKVRKSGIYWWGFHMRGGGPSSTRRIGVITA